MMRKVGIVGASKFVQRSAAGAKVTPNFVRSFSSTFPERERGEETRYVKAEEAKYKAEMRANLERILALEAGDKEREEVHELLATKPAEEKSLISKLGLDDWKFALPIGIALGVPAIANEVYVLSAETQLLAVFILSLSTLYSQAGGMIAKGLDDYRDDILAKLQKVDKNILSEVHSTMKANEKLLTLDQDIAEVHAVVDDLAVVQASVLNHAEEHRYREAIVKKLDALVAVEDAVANAVRIRMIAKVKADVVHTFTTDRAAKDAALEQAIAVLMAGSKGKLGKDVVGAAYGTSLKAYRENYAKSAPEKDELLVQLQKDVAAIGVAPIVDAKSGTNVYESHRLLHA